MRKSARDRRGRGFVQIRRAALHRLFAGICTLVRVIRSLMCRETSMFMRVSLSSAFQSMFMRVWCYSDRGQRVCRGFPLDANERNTCTISGHGLVDELHLIDSEGVRGVCFSLTLNAGGVKPTSFFDSFQSLPGWW